MPLPGPPRSIARPARIPRSAAPAPLSAARPPRPPPRQLRHSYAPIGPDEYDAAVRRAPSLCVPHAMGDHRSGRQLLADAAADAAVTVPRLSASPAGARLAGRMLDGLRARLAAYVRVAGGLPPDATVDSLVHGPQPLACA